jgi:hypothetical protein
MTETPPKETPLGEARKAAAKELGLPLDDPRVIRMAPWLVKYDQLQAQLNDDPASVEVRDLGEIDKELDELRKQCKPLKVDIEIIACCPDCGKRFPTSDIPPERSDADKLPRTIDLVAEKPADATAAQSEGGTMIPPAPKPEPKPEKLFEPAHDFHAGAPLRNGNEPWRYR